METYVDIRARRIFQLQGAHSRGYWNAVKFNQFGEAIAGCVVSVSQLRNWTVCDSLEQAQLMLRSNNFVARVIAMSTATR